MKKKIRILIVDDHFVVRIGLLTSIKMDPDLTVVAEASTAAQAIALYRQHLPDVVLMDLRLPDMSGIEATARLCKEFAGTKVIIISSYDGEEDIYRAFQAGARGYLLKDVLGAELFRVIKAVEAGEQVQARAHCPLPRATRSRLKLTQRELEVLQLLIKGLSNKEIGEVLGFTENTAKFHIKNILSKLQVSDRTEAATVAFQRGILR